MSILSPTVGLALLATFGLAQIALVWWVARNQGSTARGEGFLVADRNISWRIAAPSIAASWLWAPALFVSVQKSYELGLPGIFWFTAPNVLALVLFMWLAPRIRSQLPEGFTLPDWIRYRFPDERLHRIYLVPYFWYQLMAVCVQLFVGGLMLNYLTGLPLPLVMVAMLGIVLSYSLISGLRASVVTDFLQMALILLGIVVVVPWAITAAGDGAVAVGLGGTANKRSILDPSVAFSFGIVTSIGLIAGAIADQQYWQRSFAIRSGDVARSFVLGGLLFGLVPVALSFLGFLAANPSLGIPAPEGTGLPMIGVSTVATLLPSWAAVAFVLMLLSGLCSTLDSGLCAASSLYAIDLGGLSEEERQLLRAEPHSTNEATRTRRAQLEAAIASRARRGMWIVSVTGLALAVMVQFLFSLDRLWWIFNGLASCFVVPTLLSLYWDRLSSRGVTLGILLALLGMVGFVYGNWTENDVVTVGSAVFIVVVSLACCLAFPREVPWRPSTDSE